MRDLYVYGAGGHGKVVADLLLAERLLAFRRRNWIPARSAARPMSPPRA